MGFRNYGKKNGKHGKSKYTSVRLTGMFRTKKPGMYVGNLRKEDLEALIMKIKESKSDGKSLVFFLFRNLDKDSNSAFSLLVDSVHEDRTVRKSKKSSRIEDDFGTDGEDVEDDNNEDDNDDIEDDSDDDELDGNDEHDEHEDEDL
jgi:cobalamin biosynthesis protein CobT